MRKIDLGIIGGTGFYDFFERAEEVAVHTEFGNPAAPVAIGEWGGHNIGFLPRHGRAHEYLPHQVPYAANLAALRELGATQILGFNLVGSLSQHIGKGDLVLVDQFIDMTWGRNWTVFDRVGGGAHADLAEPFCPSMRASAIEALACVDDTVHTRATTLVINGPKFQTKAESRLYNLWGADVVNMTQSTEAAISRELELCYANLSYCTDYGVLTEEVNPNADDEPVLHSAIVQQFKRDLSRVVPLIRSVVESIVEDPGCPCRTALAGCWTQ